MEINYFKDILFDLINESDALDIADIQSNDRENSFVVIMEDGALFSIQISNVVV